MRSIDPETRIRKIKDTETRDKDTKDKETRDIKTKTEKLETKSETMLMNLLCYLYKLLVVRYIDNKLHKIEEATKSQG